MTDAGSTSFDDLWRQLAVSVLKDLNRAVRDLQNETATLAALLVQRGVFTVEDYRRAKLEIDAHRAVNEALDPEIRKLEELFEQLRQRLEDRQRRADA